MSYRLENIDIVNFDASTLNASFQQINTGVETSAACIAFKFYNSSSNLIIISYNGVDDHDILPPNSSFIFDSEANSEGFGNGVGGHKSLPAGTKIFAKTSSDTDRLIFVGYK